MAIRKMSEGISSWNNKTPFPKDRYSIHCLNEEFAASQGGNPMLKREWEIVAPETVQNGDKTMSVSGLRITQYVVTKIKNQETGELVASFDRGLGAHIGRADVIEIPFWDDGYAKPNRRDAFKKWIETEARQLTPEQTLIVDGSTDLETAFDVQESLEPVFTKTGSVDDFAFWRHKVEYFSELHALFKALKCNLVYIMHEAEKPDKGGGYSGKIRPLFTGQFGNKVVGSYTDWFRQHASNKPSTDDAIQKAMQSFGYTNKSEFMAELAKFPRNTMYYWQTESDDICDCKASSLSNFPRFIFATYQHLSKYFKKISPSTV